MKMFTALSRVFLIGILGAVLTDSAIACQHERRSSRRNAGNDRSLFSIKSVQKTDQRIEVEIESTMMVQTSWSIFVESHTPEGPRGDVVLTPYKDEPDFPTWQHIRVEGNYIITTAGVATTDHSRNLTGADVNLRIAGNGNSFFYSLSFSWGAENLDASLMPVVQQITQPYTHFKPGEEVEVNVRWSVRREDFGGIDVYFWNEAAEMKLLYNNGSADEFGIDDHEGVETNVHTTSDGTGWVMTETTLSFTNTDLEETWGFYGIQLQTGGNGIQFSTEVFPEGVKSTVPEGEIQITSDSSIGIGKGRSALIRCNAMGYPIDDITLLRTNPETAYVTTSMVRDRAEAKMYIPDVQEADAGTYHCVVSSYDRIWTKEMNVFLAEPLTVTMELLSQTSEQIVMKCVARGRPLPQVDSLTRMDGDNYRFEEIQDGGIYHMKVTSEETEVSVELTVDDVIDMDVHFTCNVHTGMMRDSARLSVYPI